MRVLKLLLADESASVLSTELVLVGTLGAAGAVVGFDAAARAVDAELFDFASSIRSLDQSYQVEGIRSESAWVAGSKFEQEPVDESLRELERERSGTTDEQSDAWREAEQEWDRLHSESDDRGGRGRAESVEEGRLRRGEGRRPSQRRRFQRSDDNFRSDAGPFPVPSVDGEVVL